MKGLILEKVISEAFNKLVDHDTDRFDTELPAEEREHEIEQLKALKRDDIQKDILVSELEHRNRLLAALVPTFILLFIGTVALYVGSGALTTGTTVLLELFWVGLFALAISILSASKEQLKEELEHLYDGF
jgi:hypothetical protein